MKVLIVGGGGRECAFANTLLLSKQVESVVLTSDNLGVYDPHLESGFRQIIEGKYSSRFQIARIPWEDFDGISSLVKRQELEIVLIGPEAPLVDGLADHLAKFDIPVVGPGKKASKLEGSKIFAKKFMAKFEIPTADFRSFTDKEADKAIEYGSSLGYPVVVKADGLCAGKGVVICNDKRQLKSAVSNALTKGAFGKAGKKIVVEKGLEGKEISFIGLFDGETYVGFPPVTDYKRQLDGNKGPNTGGMGCIAPSPFATPAVLEEFETEILQKFIEGTKAEELDYCGFIYFGCILTPEGLKVLEFNVRMGDPECQAIMPLLRTDLARMLKVCTDRRLVRVKPAFTNDFTCTVVMASESYPEGVSEPQPISGLEKIPDLNMRFSPGVEEEPTELLLHPFRLPPVNVFFSGVATGEPLKEHRTKGIQPMYASGGRVLSITSRAATMSAARKLAYDAVGNIKFKGAQYRKDIAKLR